MKPIYGDTVSNDSYYSTSCSYSAESGQAHHGSKIDRFFHKKHIPFRESRLLEKLVTTRALYEDLRSQLLSCGFTSRAPDLKPGKPSSVIGKKLEQTKSDIVAFVDLVDKGVILKPKKLNKCDSYIDSQTILKCGPKDRIQKQYHTREHLTSKSSIISNIRTGEESILGKQFKTKNIKSDPCTRIFTHGENINKKPREVLRRINPEQNIKFNRDRNKKTLRRLKRSNPHVIEGAKRSATKLKQQPSKDADSFKSNIKKSLEKITKQCHVISFKSGCSPNITEESLVPDSSSVNNNEIVARENFKKVKQIKAQEKVQAERKTTEDKILNSQKTPNKITLPDHITPDGPKKDGSSSRTGSCQLKISQGQKNKYFKMMASLISNRSKKSVPHSPSCTKNHVIIKIILTGSKRKAATIPDKLSTYGQPVKSTILSEKTRPVEKKYLIPCQAHKSFALPDVKHTTSHDKIKRLKLPRQYELKKEDRIDMISYDSIVKIKSKTCLHSKGRALRRYFCALRPSITENNNVKQKISNVIDTESAKSGTLHYFKRNISKLRSTLFPCEPYVHTLTQCVPVQCKSILKIRKEYYPNRPCKKIPVANASFKSLTTKICVGSTQQNLTDNNTLLPLPKYLIKRGSSSGAMRSKYKLSKHILRRCLCSFELDKKDIEDTPSKPTLSRGTVLPLIYFDVVTKTFPKPVNVGIYSHISTKRKTYLHKKMKPRIWTRKRAFNKPSKKILIKRDIKKLKRQFKASTDGQEIAATLMSQRHVPRTINLLSPLVTYKSDANTSLRTYKQKGFFDNSQIKRKKGFDPFSQMLSNDTNYSSSSGLFKELLSSVCNSNIHQASKIRNTELPSNYKDIRRDTKSLLCKIASELMFSPTSKRSFYRLLLRKTGKCGTIGNYVIKSNENKPATKSSNKKSVRILSQNLQPYVYHPQIDGSQDCDYHKCSEKYEKPRPFFIMNIERAKQNPKINQTIPVDALRNSRRYHNLSERRRKFKLAHSKNHQKSDMPKKRNLTDSINTDGMESRKSIDILSPKVIIKPAHKPAHGAGRDKRTKMSSSSPSKNNEKSIINIAEFLPTYIPYEIPELKKMYAVSETTKTTKKILINRENSLSYSQNLNITKNTINSLNQRCFDKNSSSSIISVSSLAFKSENVQSFLHDSKFKLFKVISADLRPYEKSSKEAQKIKTCEVNFSKQFISRGSKQKRVVNKSKKYHKVLGQHDLRNLEGHDISIYPSQIIKPIRVNRQLTGVPSLLRKCFCTMNIKVDGQRGIRKNSLQSEPCQCGSQVGILDKCDSYECQNFIMKRLMRTASELCNTHNKFKTSPSSTFKYSTTSNRSMLVKKKAIVKQTEFLLYRTSSQSPQKQPQSLSHKGIQRAFPLKEIFKVPKRNLEKHQSPLSKTTGKRLRTQEHKPIYKGSLRRFVNFSRRHKESQSAMRKVPHKASTVTPMIKKCFCTRKLQKRLQQQKVNEVHGKEKESECEPDIFMPGECNRCECPEIINKRNKHTGGTDSGKMQTHRQQHHYEPYEFQSDKYVPFTESRRYVFEPYTCEADVCVPGSYDSYAILNLIKISKTTNKPFATEGHGAKAVSSSLICFKSSELRISQSVSSTTSKPGRFKRTQSNLLFESNEIVVAREKPTSESKSCKHAERISSSFSFDTGKTASDSIRSSRHTTHARFKGLGSSEYSRDSETDVVYMPDKALGPMLKRCFCSSNLHKNHTRHTHSESPIQRVVEVKTSLSPKHDYEDLRHRNVITVYKLKAYPYKLKPYECEPGVCVPGECDPYKCLERINRRHMDRGSSTDHRGHRDNRAQHTPKERKIQPEAQIMVSNPSGSRQAVKIGSKCSFSIEFSKDKSRGGSSSQQRGVYEKPRPERVKRTVSRPTHGLSISYRNKKTQRVKVVRDSNSQVMAPIMRSTMTGVGPFLKRCFCTLQLQRQKNRRHRPDLESVSVGTETMKYRPEIHAIDRGTRARKYKPERTLDPNECEPGVCVPGECDPYECLERIKRRERHSKGSSTEQYGRTCDPDECLDKIKRRERHSKGSSTDRPRTTKIRGTSAREKRARTRHSHDRVRHHPAVIENDDSPEFAQSQRQAVRIGSSFNFSIEFYKDRSRQVPRAQPIKYVKRPHMRRVGSGTAFKTRSVYSSQKRPTYRHRKMQSQFTRSQGSGTGLKRCFCTLKLQKIGKQQTTSRSVVGSTYRHAGTRARRMPERRTVVGREVGTRIRKHALEPYECEPGVCTPGECDPYECLERIKRRMRDSSTDMAHVKTKSMSSLTPRARRHGRREQRHTELHHRIRQPPRASRALENINANHRQAVRLGSNFSFNIEFYKDRSRTATSTCSPSICREPDCTTPKCKTSSCSTTKCPIKSQGTRGAGRYHHRGLQARGVRTESRGSSSVGPLKRCFCTLTLQRAEINTTMNSLRPEYRNYRTQDRRNKIRITKNKYLHPQADPYGCQYGFCDPDVCGPRKIMQNIKGRLCLCDDSDKKYRENKEGEEEDTYYYEDDGNKYKVNKKGSGKYKQRGEDDTYYYEDDGSKYKVNKKGSGKYKQKGEEDGPYYYEDDGNKYKGNKKRGGKYKQKYTYPKLGFDECAHGLCVPGCLCSMNKKLKNKKAGRYVRGDSGRKYKGNKKGEEDTPYYEDDGSKYRVSKKGSGKYKQKGEDPYYYEDDDSKYKVNKKGRGKYKQKGEEDDPYYYEDDGSKYKVSKKGSGKYKQKGEKDYPYSYEDDGNKYKVNKKRSGKYKQKYTYPQLGFDECAHGLCIPGCLCSMNKNLKNKKAVGRYVHEDSGRKYKENKKGEDDTYYYEDDGSKFKVNKKGSGKYKQKGEEEEDPYYYEDDSKKYREDKKGSGKYKEKYSYPQLDHSEYTYFGGSAPVRPNKKQKYIKAVRRPVREDSGRMYKENKKGEDPYYYEDDGNNYKESKKGSGKYKEKYSYPQLDQSEYGYYGGSAPARPNKKLKTMAVGRYECICKDSSKKYKESNKVVGEYPSYYDDNGKKNRIRRISRTTETSVKRSRRGSPFELFPKKSPYREYEESPKVKPIVEEPRKLAKFFNYNPYTKNTVKITSNCEFNIEFCKDYCPDANVYTDGGYRSHGDFSQEFKRTATGLLRRCFCSRKHARGETDKRKSEELNGRHKHNSPKRNRCFCLSNIFTVARVEIERLKPTSQNKKHGSETYMDTCVERTENECPVAGLLTNSLRSYSVSKTVITPIVGELNNIMSDSRMLMKCVCPYKLYHARSKQIGLKPVNAASSASLIEIKPVISKYKSLSALPNKCYYSEKLLNLKSEVQGPEVFAAGRAKKWKAKMSASETKLFELKPKQSPLSISPTKLKVKTSNIKFGRCFCTVKSHEIISEYCDPSDFNVIHTDERRPLAIFTPKVYWMQYRIQHPRLRNLFKVKNKSTDMNSEVLNKEDDKSSVGLETIMSYSPVKFHKLKSKIQLNSHSKDTSFGLQVECSKIPVCVVTKNLAYSKVKNTPNGKSSTDENNKINTEEIHTGELNSLYTGRKFTVKKNKVTSIKIPTRVRKYSHSYLKNLMTRCCRIFSRRKKSKQAPGKAIITAISERHVEINDTDLSSKSFISLKNKGVVTASVYIGKKHYHKKYSQYQGRNTGRNHNLASTTLHYKARRKFVKNPHTYKKAFLKNQRKRHSLLPSKDKRHCMKIYEKDKTIDTVSKPTGRSSFHYKNTTLKTRRKYVKKPYIYKKAFLKNKHKKCCSLRHGMKIYHNVKKYKTTEKVSKHLGQPIYHCKIPAGFSLILQRGSSKVNVDQTSYNSNNYGDYIKTQKKPTPINLVKTSWELKRLLFTNNRYCEIKHIVPSGETGDCEVAFVIKSEKETEKIALQEKTQGNLDLFKTSEAGMQKTQQHRKENEEKFKQINTMSWKRQRKVDKMKMKQVMANQNTSNSVLLTDSLLDVTKQIIICCGKEILCIRDKATTGQKHLKNMAHHPKKAIADCKKSSKTSNASVKGIRMRLRAVSQVKIIKEAIKQNPALNWLFNLWIQRKRCAQNLCGCVMSTPTMVS